METAPIADGLDAATQTFLGRWNLLVSTTNWEKGRIISDWRRALVDAGAPTQEYSDDAWSRRVGGVSGQHVGRLRRVFERFGAVRESYAGLFWSHFQAAVDWNDAEMWLEGAVQNDWSVAAMRSTRWESQGAPSADQPRDGDVVATDLDEDYSPPSEQFDEVRQAGGPAAREIERDATADHATHDHEGEYGAGVPFDEGSRPAPAPPFADLPLLPADLADAFESFKLAILHHKLAGWSEISPQDVLAALAALEKLTTNE